MGVLQKGGIGNGGSGPSLLSAFRGIVFSSGIVSYFCENSTGVSCHWKVRQESQIAAIFLRRGPIARKIPQKECNYCLEFAA